MASEETEDFSMIAAPCELLQQIEKQDRIYSKTTSEGRCKTIDESRNTTSTAVHLTTKETLRLTYLLFLKMDMVYDRANAP